MCKNSCLKAWRIWKQQVCYDAGKQNKAAYPIKIGSVAGPSCPTSMDIGAASVTFFEQGGTAAYTVDFLYYKKSEQAKLAPTWYA